MMTDNTATEELRWTSLGDEELMKLRIRDLGVRVTSSAVTAQIDALFAELHSKNIPIRPVIYFGDEWFSPEGVCAIAIPFYLAHSRLVALERKLMLEVEGGNPAYFMKLIRHEAGHCFDHVFRFSRRRRWQRVFGSPAKEYAPETYHPRPYSRSFVRNLDNWYAQAHPDEDFAETFAVWLDPASNWRVDYADWPVALEKLLYVDSLVGEVAGTKLAPTSSAGLPCSAARLKSTIEKYYAQRKRKQAEDYPDFFDDDLKRIFNGGLELSKREHGAARFMSRHRQVTVDSVSHWTGERKFTVNSLVKKLAARCEGLDLRVGKEEARTSLEIAAYLATLITHYLFTGKFKRSV